MKKDIEKIAKHFGLKNQQAKTIDDTVNQPSHYTQGKYEVIDVIEDWKLGFRLANAIKYIARAEHKGKFVEDLEKAVWYLQREINNAKQNAAVGNIGICNRFDNDNDSDHRINDNKLEVSE